MVTVEPNPKPSAHCCLEVEVAHIPMFDVQVVRQRRDSGACRGLQALRRSFVLTVGDRYLKLCAGPSPSAAVLRISHNNIKCVRVRGRLLRVDVIKSGNALT